MLTNEQLTSTINQQQYYQQPQQQQSSQQISFEVPPTPSSSSMSLESTLHPFTPQEQQEHIPSSSKTNSSASNAPIKSHHATGPSEFVKKLYKMLEEPESESVVGWGTQKNTLVIKDQILFQRDILPKTLQTL
ncbi:hypothetical protein PCASD_02188 [Puccinia coronata f. sp. avenae]|uniref:HSF-type DNA-binding domain-containing protein n=1 Tax=Puccinia coronata f. sp. avenae TaxID=200324 RepID=A0A2N5VI38_9BASI|nr:hypothetical protein PCASD_02188 [Puccinia coronata f. sp. avenae]